MQLSLSLAPPHLLHPGAVNAIAAWRSVAGHAPLRLLRDDRIGPGRRIGMAIAVPSVALGLLALAGLAASPLLPGRVPSGVAPQVSDVPRSEVAEREIALALQAAGAFSGPLPGHDRPALRFGASPEMPLPALPSTEGTPEIAPAADIDSGTVGTAVAEPSPRRTPVVEPAAGTRPEPLRMAARPGRAEIAAADATAHPRRAGASVAKPRRIALASRGPETIAARIPGEPKAAWTLPRALAPTSP